MVKTILLLLIPAVCSAGGICSKQFVVQKRVLVVDNAHLAQNYHSVGSHVYNEAVIEKAVERAITKAFANLQLPGQPPAEPQPDQLATKYPFVAANCISCHGDEPKGNEISFSQIYRSADPIEWKGKTIDNPINDLPDAVRLSAIRAIDSQKMPKGKTLTPEQAEGLFNNLVYGAQ